MRPGLLLLLGLALAGACEKPPAAQLPSPAPAHESPASPARAEPALTQVRPVERADDVGQPSAQGAPRWEAREERDRGLLCLAAGKPNATLPVKQRLYGSAKWIALEPGRPVHVALDAAACMSASCNRNAKHVCTVEQDAQAPSQLRVRSHATYELGLNMSCTENCKPLTAACALPKLPAGSYELVYGEQRLPFKLPSSVQSACVDNRSEAR
jgi:hypothetical protein